MEKTNHNFNLDTYISFYLSKCTFRLFKSALRQIGNPPYIRFLVSNKDMSIVMQAFDEKTQISFKISEKMLAKGNSQSLVVHSKRLCSILASVMGWDVTKNYRIKGRIYPSQQLVKFDLSTAVIAMREKKKEINDNN
ncbi:MAG: hypothetical protein HUK24_09405 [Sphaerochaetaceae bacterium]|nr:hypothetical protein [Sphaerochaetaceae bacterium]